jgi:hypothetical protein
MLFSISKNLSSSNRITSGIAMKHWRMKPNKVFCRAKRTRTALGIEILREVTDRTTHALTPCFQCRIDLLAQVQIQTLLRKRICANRQELRRYEISLNAHLWSNASDQPATGESLAPVEPRGHGRSCRRAEKIEKPEESGIFY